MEAQTKELNLITFLKWLECRYIKEDSYEKFNLLKQGAIATTLAVDGEKANSSNVAKKVLNDPKFQNAARALSGLKPDPITIQKDVDDFIKAQATQAKKQPIKQPIKQQIV